MSHLDRPRPSIDLTVASVVSVASRPGALDLLDGAERLRHARLRHPADRGRFVAGRVLVREAVGDAMGVRPDDVRLAVGARGRVRVESPDAAPDFSLAHAGGVVALALTTSGRVGVDLEPIRPAADLPALALTPTERAAVAILDSEARTDRVLEAWTAKEAYAKLVGHGLCLDMTRLPLARLAARPRLAFRTLVVALAGERYRLTVVAWSPIARAADAVDAPGALDVRLTIDPRLAPQAEAAA